MSDFFLRSNSNSSTSRPGYYRLFALASVDMLITFPVGVVNVTLVIIRDLHGERGLPFYDGWAATQAAWGVLFPRVALILDFLHAFLKIRDRVKHLGAIFKPQRKQIWEA